jgi:hypothetical protein
VGALCFTACLGPAPSLGFATGAGFAAGLCWVAGSFGIDYQFEQKPWTLLLINGGYPRAVHPLRSDPRVVALNRVRSMAVGTGSSLRSPSCPATPRRGVGFLVRIKELVEDPAALLLEV